jgi:methylated-DNA-[protein]-cysteine S-methyltransferase
VKRAIPPHAVGFTPWGGVDPQLRVFDTPLGPIALAAVRHAVVRLTLGDATRSAAVQRLRAALERAARTAAKARRSPAADAAPDVSIDEVIALLCRYAAGEPVDLRRPPIELANCSPFRRHVLLLCREIPYGQAVAYGALAAAAGAPRAARAVGGAMAANPLPLLIPCHRVVAAGGDWGGFSAPAGTTLKRRLLEMEGAHRPLPSWDDAPPRPPAPADGQRRFAW